MTDLFSATIRLSVSGLVRILSVSAYWRGGRKETEETGETGERWCITYCLYCTIWIMNYSIMYQDVVGPALPGKVQCRLLQLHHVLVSAVGPVLRTQLSCIGPETHRHNTTCIYWDTQTQHNMYTHIPNRVLSTTQRALQHKLYSPIYTALSNAALFPITQRSFSGGTSLKGNFFRKGNFRDQTTNLLICPFLII